MPETQGYLLPDGDLGDDEIACTVVFYPDREEYRAALQGSLAYLATWIAWEKDDDKRGKDAAANWYEAYEKTLECWRMGCLEQMQDDINLILLFLQSKKDCCDPNLTFGPPTEVGTDIDPGEGDPPDFYGETAVVDWDDWYEHVCFNAHAWVDELIRQAETIEVGLSAGAIAIGLVAGAIAVIAFFATGGLLSMPVLMLAASALAAGGASESFEQAVIDLENARTDIVCALLLGNDVGQAVEDALTIGSTWTLFFSLADYETATAIIYEGGQGTEYLSSEVKDDCVSCDYEQLEDGDLTLHPVNTYTTNLQWNAGPKTWTADSLKPGSCYQQWIQFFTDPSKTVAKQVRVHYVGCDVATTCAGSKHHRGYLQTLATLVYELDHPSLPTVEDGVVEEIYDTHNSTFTIEFKLYEPT